MEEMTLTRPMYVVKCQRGNLKNLKKLFLVFLMMFALSFAFACGKEDETNDDKQNQTVEYTVTFVVDGEKLK